MTIFDLQAALCQTMSNPARLAIVHELRQGPSCVADIARAAGLTPAKASQHLAVLRQQKIVVARPQGGRMEYRLANPKVAQVCDLMREILADQAAEIEDVIRQLAPA